jgi:hypothetical protein
VVIRFTDWKSEQNRVLKMRRFYKLVKKIFFKILRIEKMVVYQWKFVDLQLIIDSNLGIYLKFINFGNLNFFIFLFITYIF